MSDNTGTCNRWALRHVDGWLLSSYCFYPSAAYDDRMTPTFATRAKAREARRRLTSYRRDCRPAKVIVTVTPL